MKFVFPFVVNGIVAIVKPERHVHIASYCAASNNSDHAPQSLYYCRFATHLYGVVLRAHSISGKPCIQPNAS